MTVAVIFELSPASGRKQAYLDLDEEAVRKWRNVQKHREAQAKGRAGIFTRYRLRVAQVLRDYTQEERAEAPKDSRKVHG